MSRANLVEYNLIIIEPAEEKDLEECAELGRIPEFELPSGRYIESTSLINYLDWDFFLVARKDNQIIGYVLGEKMKGKVGMLWFLMIHKDFRDKGLGTMLLKEFEKRAKTRGVEWLVLYGPTFNKPTITLLIFLELIVIMEKNLIPPGRWICSDT